MELPLPATLLLQQGIDLLLRLDPSTRDALVRLEGRVIRFEVTSPDVELTLSITDQSIVILRHFDGEVDVELSGPLDALLSLRDGNEALFKGRVKLNGDLGVAQTLAEVVAGIDVDAEEWLSRVTGDLVAHRMGNAARDFTSWLDRTASGFRDNVSDYLQDEAQVVAEASEVEAFSEDVARLRSDVDRLAARISLIEKQASAE